MEIIKHTLDEQVNIPPTFKELISCKDICFLDIETTGFNKQNNHIILIGMLYSSGTETEILQFFTDSQEYEKNLLQEFVKYITKFAMIVTFNGDAFDIPFINSRLALHNIDYQIDKTQCIDILKVVRAKKNLLDLEKYNLKSIEKLLGIDRDDTISGKESVEMYYDYIKSKDNNIKEIILRHNYEDIYNLTKVLKIFDVIDEKSRVNLDTKYLSNNINITIKLENVKCSGNIMEVEGDTTILELSDEIHYGEFHILKWYPRVGKFEISLQIKEGKLSDGSKCTYLDSKDLKLDISKIDKLNYNIPNNILILSHNNKVVLNNIKILINYLWKELSKSKFTVNKQR